MVEIFFVCFYRYILNISQGKVFKKEKKKPSGGYEKLPQQRRKGKVAFSLKMCWKWLLMVLLQLKCFAKLGKQLIVNYRKLLLLITFAVSPDKNQT